MLDKEKVAELITIGTRVGELKDYLKKEIEAKGELISNYVRGDYKPHQIAYEALYKAETIKRCYELSKMLELIEYYADRPASEIYSHFYDEMLMTNYFDE